MQSLGLIEAIGLAAGIEAADAAVKSANVTLVGYEFAKGGGWTTVKVVGDVGAVKAAVAAGVVAAKKVNGVASSQVIARPSNSLELLIRNADTVGYKMPVPNPEPPTPVAEPVPVEEMPAPVAEQASAVVEAAPVVEQAPAVEQPTEEIPNEAEAPLAEEPVAEEVAPVEDIPAVAEEPAIESAPVAIDEVAPAEEAMPETVAPATDAPAKPNYPSRRGKRPTKRPPNNNK